MHSGRTVFFFHGHCTDPPVDMHVNMYILCILIASNVNPIKRMSEKRHRSDPYKQVQVNSWEGQRESERGGGVGRRMLLFPVSASTHSRSVA